MSDLKELARYITCHEFESSSETEIYLKEFLDWQPDSKAPDTARDVVTVFSNGVVAINNMDIFTGSWLITHPNAHVTHWRKLIKGIDTP